MKMNQFSAQEWNTHTQIGNTIRKDKKNGVEVYGD